MSDYHVLSALAKKARRAKRRAPGPWTAEWADIGGSQYVFGPDERTVADCGIGGNDIANYIAACSPDVILRLLDELVKARADVIENNVFIDRLRTEIATAADGFEREIATVAATVADSLVHEVATVFSPDNYKTEIWCKCGAVFSQVNSNLDDRARIGFMDHRAATR